VTKLNKNNTQKQEEKNTSSHATDLGSNSTAPTTTTSTRIYELKVQQKRSKP